MDFTLSPKVVQLQKRVSDFMNEHVYPIEKRVEGRPWLYSQVALGYDFPLGWPNLNSCLPSEPPRRTAILPR